MAVIDHADHALAASFHFDANRLGAGVERVFKELFHDRRGTFDNFPRGNFIRHRLRQYAYSAHAWCSLRGRSFSSGVVDGVIWASAPEASCKYLLGIGSRVNWP